jgi:membrane protease subunit HflC
VVETVSQAEREAEITRGEADAERNRIYAESFGKNPEFFSFYRSLAALEKSLQSENSTMVFSPDSEFLTEMFGAIRAVGLSKVDIEDIDIDSLREMAPEMEVSPDLPETERKRLEEQATEENDAEATN